MLGFGTRDRAARVTGQTDRAGSQLPVTERFSLRSLLCRRGSGCGVSQEETLHASGIPVPSFNGKSHIRRNHLARYKKTLY